ncbi:MAG: hypothetical protein ACKOQ8_05605 [Micrococcales bacterium]
MNTETIEQNLIERAQTALVSKPVATKDTTKRVEAADPIVANELLAQRSEIADAIKELTKQKEAIDAILKDAIGKNDELLVNGAVVASISRWRETGLNKEFILENFAVVDYPEMFTRVTRERLNIKK